MDRWLNECSQLGSPSMAVPYTTPRKGDTVVQYEECDGNRIPGVVQYGSLLPVGKHAMT